MSPARRVVAFPPGRRGVLLPADDRRAAAIGIALFTASKPRVIATQRLAAHVVRHLGTRWLLQPSAPFEPPVPDEAWEALSQQWRDALGAWDAVTLYRRRQVERSGSTGLLSRAGRPVALVKVRPGVGGRDSLEHEQQALGLVGAARPRTFSVPEPLGAGHHDDLHWSAQSVVLVRPHEPVLTPDPALFEEVGAALGGAGSGRDDPDRPWAHNDLTPWNLRREHRGRVWLYDWEDRAPAPPDADRALFHATAHAVRGTRLPTGLDARGVQWWLSIVDSPGARPDPNPELAPAIRGALAQLRRTATGGGRIDG